MEFFATNEARIHLTMFFWRSGRRELQHSIIVFEGIDGHLAIVFHVYAEDRWLFFSFSGADFSLAPSAPIFIVWGLDVSLVIGENIDLVLGETLLGDESTKVIEVQRDKPKSMMGDECCSVC